MLRQAAFEGNNKLLKGGLHCHTTRSDGRGDPKEVIELHAKNGYDFLALTDHRIYNYENFAPETGVMIIPGMEMDCTFEANHWFRCFHTVCLGPDDKTNGFKQDQSFPPYSASSQYEFQACLDEIHKNNNITFYCHPEWSSTPARYFENLKGEFAVEVWNTGCVVENNMDYDAPYWDEILGQGKKWFGVAVDDGHPMFEHCQGWVMVNSEKKVTSVLKALQEGKFYSSTGPVIKDFYIDDNGIARIECDGADKIVFSADRHPNVMFTGENNSLTSAEWDTHNHGGYDYIRVTVFDKDGKRAWTNPIWLNEDFIKE